MFDILSLVTVEDEARKDGRVWVEIDPAVVYPATAEYIVEHVAEFPAYAYSTSDADLVTKALNGDWLAGFTLKAKTTVQQAASVPAAAWELVGSAKDEVTEVHARNMALESARLFFTEALHQAIGAPIGVHILKNETYRL